MSIPLFLVSFVICFKILINDLSFMRWSQLNVLSAKSNQCWRRANITGNRTYVSKIKLITAYMVSICGQYASQLK
jgi:hypothetical protein